MSGVAAAGAVGRKSMTTPPSWRPAWTTMETATAMRTRSARGRRGRTRWRRPRRPHCAPLEDVDADSRRLGFAAAHAVRARSRRAHRDSAGSERPPAAWNARRAPDDGQDGDVCGRRMLDVACDVSRCFISSGQQCLVRQSTREVLVVACLVPASAGSCRRRRRRWKIDQNHVRPRHPQVRALARRGAGLERILEHGDIESEPEPGRIVWRPMPNLRSSDVRAACSSASGPRNSSRSRTHPALRR